MKVTIFSCGPAANESELKAFEHLKSRLQSTPGTGEWALLTNLAFSVTHQLQSMEIDIVVIGPSGVQVVEVKHWTAQWIDANSDIVEKEADKVTQKARKIGTTLRKHLPTLPLVNGSFLLTQEVSKVKRCSGKMVRGVQIFSLNEWRELLKIEGPSLIDANKVAMFCRILEPRSIVAIDGSMRRFAGYANLELQTPKEDRFHRIYKGCHSIRQDRVVLHLYDLSAIDDSHGETKAKREFEALQQLQLFPWAPRILDSFQHAPCYEGEMFFFTLVDPAAPCIQDRAEDDSWEFTSRLAFTRDSIKALVELHETKIEDGTIVHRNLTTKTVLVKHDNTPIFTGFNRAKMPSGESVASSGIPVGGWDETIAPEVRSQGWSVADHRSDIFSLCVSLKTLFQDKDQQSQQIIDVLDGGIVAQPEKRTSLSDLEIMCSELLGDSAPPISPPPARFWSEDQIVPFRDRDYRIISRLGSGGIGMTFKVVELDRTTKEELGAYVAKVAHNEQIDQGVLRAHRIARSHLGRHAGLSAIFEVAKEWRDNQFIALLTWIEGSPLGEFTGVFPLLTEDQQEDSAESLALRWLVSMCEALNVLHRNGLVHGDLSLRNIIVSGSELVLTDYDFVVKIGEMLRAPGTVMYSSPSFYDKLPASPSDDIYSLAACFFHVIFDKEPFLYGNKIDKKRGLNWAGIEREAFPTLAPFLNKATNPNEKERFSSTIDAICALKKMQPTDQQLINQEKEPQQINVKGDIVGNAKIEGAIAILRTERVDWLLSVLRSYPGSRWGNNETRGLDTTFATQTYVETNLEETLLKDIKNRSARLVILCGNAGDGKTALLQYIAVKLGLGKHNSSERILEEQLKDGLLVRMNLDGSASWEGRTADEILDEFLKPFQQGLPQEDIVHLLAINDGRLLEWLDGVESRQGFESPLTRSIYNLLEEETSVQESHIRFISLNQRSLVGGVTKDNKSIQTDFLERLIDNLYGGTDAIGIWNKCLSCSAQDRCEVFRAAHVFGPEGLPNLAEKEVRNRSRQRLFEAIQAVHLRGETHITVRELRAALVYILFGVHFCDDYHGQIETQPIPYWDRAFAPDSPGRQGEVLRELARFDPALEAHPQIDRHLLSQQAPDDTRSAPHYAQLSLESARRRAYFEWTKKHIIEIANDNEALDLARGRHLKSFRNLSLDNEGSDLEWRAEICAKLCGGISRLEDLPPQALDRPGVVPLRILPRTPTETAFWIEKPLSSFLLEADLSQEIEGMDRLHRQAYLIYRYRDDRTERLRLGAELFHLLLELSEGYQLGDVSTDDTFAHLSIFVQRLVREDEREMFAWNPIKDEAIHRISAIIENTGENVIQNMVLSEIPTGGN